MFVDLVGSTMIAEQHEPEVVRDVLRSYQDVCARVIKAHGGHIFRYIGDGIMVYFGFPTAREDDALHAVLAGLEIIDGLAEIAPSVERQHGIELAARVGIHTGLVLMSDMGDGSAREPDAAIGPAPNEAARLQSLAPPNGVVISDDTHEIVRGYFEVEALGTPPMKGIDRKVEVFRVVGRTGATQRLQAGSATRTPLVGRNAERRVLREVWDALGDAPVAGARVHTVTIRGEAGIGKSRLAEWLASEAASGGDPVLSAYCASDRQASRFFPLVGMLERRLDLQSDDGGDVRLSKTEQGCASLGLDVSATMPFLVDVLGLPAGDRFALPALDPRLLRERAFDALADFVCAHARQHRTLLLVDDLQWADQTTVEWLTRLTKRDSTLPFLLLAMARPEFHPPWAGPACLAIDVGRLPDSEHMQLIHELAEVHEIPQNLFGVIADRSDGNPLFTEEIARALGHSASGAHGTQTIPRTIRDLLTARLDALGSDKSLAQSAAVIGRDIDVELLRTVTGLSRKQLSTSLAHLSGAGIVEEISGAQPPVTHRFTHALVRDASYESQEQGQARAVHLGVAQALATRPDVDPGLVAQHFDAANVADQAVNWYLLAGFAAQSAAADAEAIRYLDRGLEVLPSLPEGRERDLQEFNLHLVRGTSHVNTAGYSAPGAVADFRRSLELSEEVATGIEVILPTSAIWAYYLVHGDLRSAAEAVERLMAMSEPEFEPEILCCAGVQKSFEGRFRESREILVRSVDAFEQREPGARSPHRGLLPNDVYCVALTHLGVVLALVGETSAANARLDEAMQAAQALPHYPTGAFTEAYVASYAAMVASFAQRFDDTLSWYEHATAIAERYGMQFWLSTATMGRAIALGYLGDPRGALDILTPALEQWRSLGAGALVPLDTTHRGYLRLQIGDLTDALADVDDALALAEDTTEHLFSAEAHRVRGAILLAMDRNDVAAARSELRTARALAAQQGSLLFELRAAIDLVELPGESVPEDVDALRDVVQRMPAGAEVPEVEHSRALISR
jgi:class 3 adenylate cyclase/tetratricopeptide (TPR) repeat protein